MEEAFSIPPLSKVRLLCVHYGIAFEGQPAISDIAGFATAFKEDVNVDDLFFDTNVSQAIRNSKEYAGATFSLTANRKQPAYSIDIVPAILRFLGIRFDDAQWKLHRAGVFPTLSCGNLNVVLALAP